MEPLKAAKVGFLVEQTASLGMSSTLMVLTPVVRNVVCRMSGEQLQVVATHPAAFHRSRSAAPRRGRGGTRQRGARALT